MVDISSLPGNEEEEILTSEGLRSMFGGEQPLPEEQGVLLAEEEDTPESLRAMFGGGRSEQPEAVEEPPEEVGAFENVWNQVKGGYYDYQSREEFYSSLDVAEYIKDIKQGKKRPPSKYKALDFYKEAADVSPVFRGRDPGATRAGFQQSIARRKEKEFKSAFKTEEEYNKALSGIAVDRATVKLENKLKKAAEYRAKGEKIPFSKETLDFLDENSGKTIWEAFKEAPAKIVVELGARSAMSMAPSVAYGVTGATVGSLAGPIGTKAGFALGTSYGSARVEYAASIVDAFQRGGVDLNDPKQILAAIENKEFMRSVDEYAKKRAVIIGGVDGLASLVGMKHLTPGIENMLAREAANIALQTPIQATLGASGEALAQQATTGEINWREVAAEAAGEGITAPIDITAAAISGARQKLAQRKKVAEEVSPISDIDQVFEEAAAQEAAAGGDALSQAMAGAEASTQEAEKLLIEVKGFNEDTAALEDALGSEAEISPEQQALIESAEAFDAVGIAAEQQKRRDFEQAEQELLNKKEIESREAEYQKQLQEGEQAVLSEDVKPTPTLADVIPEEIRAKLEAIGKPIAEEAPEVAPVIAEEAPEVAPVIETEIDEVAHEAATSPTNEIPEPSQAQIEAGNYKKGHVNVQGLDISIENPTGSIRKGVDEDTGKEWSTEMKDHYGYIKRTEGKDGDQVDVFIGDSPESAKVFVVDQINQETGSFDEHKVMLGYDNKMKAKRGYKRNFFKGWKVGEIREMPIEEFKNWVKEGDTKQPAINADVVSQEDLLAIAERQEAKGRKKPKIISRVEEEVTKGVALEVAEAAAAPIIKELPGLNANIVANASEVPKRLREELEKAGDKVRGVFDPRTNQFYVFADKHATPEDVAKTVLHEGVAHQGLRNTFGEKISGVLSDVFERADTTELSRVAVIHGFDINDSTQQLDIAEEYIASIAESGKNPSLMRRVISAVKNLLAKAGVKLKMTDADVQSLLAKTKKGLQKREKSRLSAKVGDISTDVAIIRKDKQIKMLDKLKTCLSK